MYDILTTPGVPIDTTVMTLTATDLDNSVLTYDIIGGNDEGYFKVRNYVGVVPGPHLTCLVEVVVQSSHCLKTRICIDTKHIILI